MVPRQIFVAFAGAPIEQEAAIAKIAEGYECWNLAKFGFGRFVSTVQCRIPPEDRHTLQNDYKRGAKQLDDPFGLNASRYKEASWGLLLPNPMEYRGPTHEESLFLLNLYSPHFLYPVFYVSEQGIWRLAPKTDFWDENERQQQNQAERFKRQEFVKFYEALSTESMYAGFRERDNRATHWGKEDWRIFVACLLFAGLADYTSKLLFTWQREPADMATILEALFTAGTDDNREVSYKLRKRVAALLSHRFQDVEQRIKRLYKVRSDFVHGSFFVTAEKQVRKQAGFITVEGPPLKVLYEQKEMIRQALAACLYINKARKTAGQEFYRFGSIINILECSIIDVDLRKLVENQADAILGLMDLKNAF